jgi:hypothetical protein
MLILFPSRLAANKQRPNLTDEAAFDAVKAARRIVLDVSAAVVRPGVLWKSKRSVRIVLSAFLPPGPMRTTEGRRKRLRVALDAQMARLSWTRTGSIYKRSIRAL